MGFDDILKAFGTRTEFPKAAILAARAQRPEIVPRFIAVVDDFVDNGTNEEAVFLIFHLLGEWRETSAYRPLCRLLQCDMFKIEAAIGDAKTETCRGVVAAVFDGDPGPLYDVVLSVDADEYVRSEVCEALAMLVVRGDLDKAEVARFLRDGFDKIQPRAGEYVWVGWAQTIAMLGLDELRPLVERAYAEELIYPPEYQLKEFEQDLRHAHAHPDAPWPIDGGRYELFGDTIEELANWASFVEEDDEFASWEDDEFASSEAPALPPVSFEPVTNPFRNVGRNDPCPCGSGKKFKKCCLSRVGGA